MTSVTGTGNAVNGYNQLLHSLLLGDADPNGGVSRHAPGLTPLHVAAQYGNTAAAKILKRFGANPSAVTAHHVCTHSYA